LLLAAAGVPSPAAAAAPAVAAASDLKFALEEIAGQYRTESGREVRLTFGSSGNLARQIEQGAPFEVFLSADEDLVFALADKGLTRDRGASYAIGRIVLFVPVGSPVEPDGELEGLRRALDAGQVKHFAIANPEHAPYGRAAEQALRRAGLWQQLQGRLVLGENASQAAQFAVAGDTEGGIIPHSLALAPTMANRGRYALLPESSHAPLRQRMALLKRARDDGARFYAYLQGPAARAIMRRHGFTLPGE
jgi:molybdate transport system substrate-binding protein